MLSRQGLKRESKARKTTIPIYPIDNQNRRMNLPHDLIEFLQNNTLLQYDPSECEAGKIKLLSLNKLKIELFPTDADNGPIDNTSDPHCGEMGTYMVPAVSLVAKCEDYEPMGLLLWFPEEECYGTWDSSHTLLEVFSSEVTWSDIVANPLSYINSFWDEERVGGLAPLIPWPKYDYDPVQSHWPRPMIKK